MSDVTFLIFGVSGDLARRKLIPALYKLMRAGKLKKFILVGAAIDDVTIETILTKSREFLEDIDEAVWRDFVARCYYQKLNFNTLADFTTLHDLVTTLEKQHELVGNRIAYCAAASDFFARITHNLVKSALVKKYRERQVTWQRVVYEKPFGKDLASAHALNDELAKLLNEKQIYRIDHYLTKEIVGNITLVRFTNCIFEPLWDHRFIDNVQIVLSEQVGLEGRGLYYDSYGALRDVVQNHVLELLALIGMEAPTQLTGEHIRTERTRVLEHVQVVDGILGQFEGYKQEPGIAADSTTETFAALKLMIHNRRWAGVPFYVKTGKCLDKKETVIHIKLKSVDCLIKVCPSDSNYLTIKVAPDATFSLELNAKKIGAAYEVTPIKMEFCHSCVFGPLTPTAHEVLIEEIMRGDQAVSVRFDEIEYAWKVVDAVRALSLPLYTYQKGTTGPAQLADFGKKHGLRWRS
jgi:glucose-6-phosphate 1-dehydrogenase